MKFAFTALARTATSLSATGAEGTDSETGRRVRSALHRGRTSSAAIRGARIDRYDEVIHSPESITPE